MSLRQAAKGLAGRLSTAGAQLQQRRYAGDLPVKANKHIEQWGTMREHVENDFKWNAKTLTTLAIAVGVLPYVIYTSSIKEFNLSDERAGRPKREMWGSS